MSNLQGAWPCFLGRQCLLNSFPDPLFLLSLHPRPVPLPGIQGWPTCLPTCLDPSPSTRLPYVLRASSVSLLSRPRVGGTSVKLLGASCAGHLRGLHKYARTDQDADVQRGHKGSKQTSVHSMLPMDLRDGGGGRGWSLPSTGGIRGPHWEN